MGWNATRGSGYKEAPRYIISYLMEGVYSQQSRKVNYENFPTAPRKLVIEEGNLELVGGGEGFLKGATKLLTSLGVGLLTWFNLP